MGSCLSSDGGQGSPCSPSSTIDGRHRKRGSTSSDSKRHGELHKIPGRLFSNGASDCASLFTQQGKKGTNQDAMIVWENFGARSDTVFCGVFDGHGPFGHMVARKVRDSLPLKISAQWDANSECDDPRESSSSTMESIVVEKMGSVCIQSATFDDLKEKEKYPEFFWALKESYLKAYKSMDRELKMHRKINCICSGTTAVTLVKQGQDLVVGNLGDSRAILATRDAANSLVAVQLTVDLKPNLPKEQERIRQCKGRVFSLQEEPDVARVWLPNNDSPGLAMARAFGDFCLKDFGLISVPETSYRHLTERDEFIVLATDGVWDVLSNKEVVDTIASAPSQSSAARFLVETAVKTWRYKFPTSKIDDCAVVCLFLNADSSRSIISYIGKKERFESTNAKTCIEDQVLSGPVTLERSGTVRSSLEKPCTGEIGSPMKATKSRAHRRPSNGTAVTGKLAGTEWSALEGVSRANTLLTLPEFVSEQSPHTKMLI